VTRQVRCGKIAGENLSWNKLSWKMLSNENMRIPFWKNAVGNIFVLACWHLLILYYFRGKCN
jgi:hypothetical protein